MAYCDFVVKYNPEKDSLEDLTERIIYSVFIGRIKAKKPCIVFVSGDSGEGKSISGGLRLQEILFKVQGLTQEDYLKHINDINVYTPLEFPQKQEKLLFDKDLKKINVICMHEAREIIKAKHWQSFLTQAVGDINAMSRSVKRMVTIIISQFIRDITTDIRYTLNYYIVVRRPKRKAARLYINVMWKDDRDLEKPKLRKRKLSGYLVYPSGKYRRFVPQYLELRKPDKRAIKIFEERDRAAKSGIIKRKIDKLISDMSADMEKENQKVKAMIDYYSTNVERLTSIGRLVRGKWKVNKEVKNMHDMSKIELDEFQKGLNEAFKTKGYIEDAKPADEPGSTK